MIPEPGRQVIREQAYIGGDATPDRNVLKFLDLTISRTIHHMITAASTQTPVFFDRSIVDQVNGFGVLKIDIPAHLRNAVELFRYHRSVFIVPPWPEIYRSDAERTHSFDKALADYAELLKIYERSGYEAVFVPQVGVEDRVDFVLRILSGE